jgi:hypothetical protein
MVLSTATLFEIGGPGSGKAPEPAAKLAEPRPTGDDDCRKHRCAGRRELQEALLEWDPVHVGDDHWKISVVQSPP